MTSEQWLITAIKQLDDKVFEGELNTATHNFQIYFGRVKGKRGTECVQPSDTELVTMDDFFPTTIGVDYQTKDVQQMMANLALECIRAFMGITKGKQFKKTCERFNFDKPFTEAHPSPYLRDLLMDAYKATVAECGEFPGQPISFPVKEKKEKKPTKAVFFCPECGIEYSVSLKQLKNNQGTPTCICGARCGRDLTDESDKKEENAESQN